MPSPTIKPGLRRPVMVQGRYDAATNRYLVFWNTDARSRGPPRTRKVAGGTGVRRYAATVESDSDGEQSDSTLRHRAGAGQGWFADPAETLPTLRGPSVAAMAPYCTADVAAQTPLSRGWGSTGDIPAVVAERYVVNVATSTSPPPPQPGFTAAAVTADAATNTPPPVPETAVVTTADAATNTSPPPLEPTIIHTAEAATNTSPPPLPEPTAGATTADAATNTSPPPPEHTIVTNADSATNTSPPVMVDTATATPYFETLNVGGYPFWFPTEPVEGFRSIRRGVLGSYNALLEGRAWERDLAILSTEGVVCPFGGGIAGLVDVGGGIVDGGGGGSVGRDGRDAGEDGEDDEDGEDGEDDDDEEDGEDWKDAVEDGEDGGDCVAPRD